MLRTVSLVSCLTCFENNYHQMPYGVERAEILDLPSLFNGMKRSDLFMIFTLPSKAPINPAQLFGSTLARNIREKLRLCFGGRIGAQANFFTHRNLREFNQILSANQDVMGLPLQGFKELLLRVA